VSRGNILKYRSGYLITSANDTLFGLIWHENDGSIYFIKKGTIIKTPIVGNFSQIPLISADNGRIKSFCRNGIFYEIHPVPPSYSPAFLNVLEQGKLTLYILISNYQDARTADNSTGGLIGGGLAGAFIGTLSSANTKKEEEYYDVKAYYVQKKPGDELVLISRSEKKFREVFYPLIKDNPAFLKSLVGQSFDFDHLRALVKTYNLTANK
jgi:hypothetical protein